MIRKFPKWNQNNSKSTFQFCKILFLKFRIIPKLVFSRFSELFSRIVFSLREASFQHWVNRQAACPRSTVELVVGIRIVIFPKYFLPKLLFCIFHSGTYFLSELIPELYFDSLLNFKSNKTWSREVLKSDFLFFS